MRLPQPASLSCFGQAEAGHGDPPRHRCGTLMNTHEEAAQAVSSMMFSRTGIRCIHRPANIAASRKRHDCLSLLPDQTSEQRDRDSVLKQSGFRYSQPSACCASVSPACAQGFSASEPTFTGLSFRELCAVPERKCPQAVQNRDCARSACPGSRTGSVGFAATEPETAETSPPPA